MHIYRRLYVERFTGLLYVPLLGGPLMNSAPCLVNQSMSWNHEALGVRTSVS